MAFEFFIADVLNDRSPNWDEAWRADDFLEACRIHGVAALIAAAIENNRLSLPEQTLPQFRETLDGHKVFELLHTEQLQQLFTVLAHADIKFILLKGTPLAHQVYAHAYLRSRGDTDLLIADRDRGETDALLRKLGYQPTYESQMEAGSYQRAYTLIDDLAYDHTIDVHWHVSNRQLFALAFPWEVALANSIDFTALRTTGTDASPGVLCLNPVYQVLHACMHRTCHMTSRQHAQALTHRGDRLIWLLDIHLICKNFSAANWDELTRVCIEKKICAIVADTFDAVAEFFPVAVPPALQDQLVSAGRTEISRRLLTHSRFRTLLVDLTSLPDWRSKLTLLRDAAFPPAEQMLFLYHKSSVLWLPYLYVSRIMGFRP